MFLNCVQELEWLTQRYHSDQAEFIVMTGWRRVGKTALLSEFADDKAGIYFLAYLDSADTLLRNLSRAGRRLSRTDFAPYLGAVCGNHLGRIGALASTRWRPGFWPEAVGS